MFSGAANTEAKFLFASVRARPEWLGVPYRRRSRQHSTDFMFSSLRCLRPLCWRSANTRRIGKLTST
ncbi:hypothetical protein E2C01_070527 [Portunus trituberculatus]|uniref:Uncharacterized protein n=1 Tax=Portunus trituberculatus TaxID=210409 RepID=A0A5B7HXI8_PORTR|nr:hypothetical protein [Portunus trituberculatus]